MKCSSICTQSEVLNKQIIFKRSLCKDFSLNISDMCRYPCFIPGYLILFSTLIHLEKNGNYFWSKMIGTIFLIELNFSGTIFFSTKILTISSVSGLIVELLLKHLKCLYLMIYSPRFSNFAGPGPIRSREFL